MKTTHQFAIIFSALITLFLFSCAPQQEAKTVPVTTVESDLESSEMIDSEFTLKTVAGNGKLLYVGMGGEIDGIINPGLTVQPGSIIRIILINGDGMVHDLFLPDLDTKTDYVRRLGDQTEMIFEVGNLKPGTYIYYCTLPGHRKAGQEGRLIVESSD